MNIRTVAAFDEPGTVEQIARMYQKTFGLDPWNEGYRCPICGRAFPITATTKACQECFCRNEIFVLLVECWPRSKVISDFYREMSKPGAICCIAEDGENILGFAWGYTMSVDENIDDRLEAPGIRQLVHGEFFYLDEIGVLPRHQRQGIGKALLNTILAGKERILLRTLNESQMFHLARKMGGHVVLGISKKRVIMSINR